MRRASREEKLHLFGLPLSPEQSVALSTLINVLRTATVVLWSRGAVTPMATLDPHDPST